MEGGDELADELNRRITLKSRPIGLPVESNFELLEGPAPRPGDGEILVRNLWLSLDPYMRGLMGTAPSYAESLKIGDVISGGTVGEVVTSLDPGFEAGDVVQGYGGWQNYFVSHDGRDLRKLDAGPAPVSTALGVLGMPGLTAYCGLLEIGRPRPGDTVVVSTAAGAVGAVAGQVAKLTGCRVVGITGSRAKVDYIVNELGFDAGINYKTDDLATDLADACPDGVDVYFDNVGGAVSNAVFAQLAYKARVIICGLIAQYNLEDPDEGRNNLRYFLVRQARLEGFIISRFADRFDEARQRLKSWVAEGRIKYREHVVEGLENAPQAYIGMMNGENFGKLLVKVAD